MSATDAREQLEALLWCTFPGITAEQVDTLLAGADLYAEHYAAERFGQRAPSQPHGTRAAYVRHKRHGEQPCDACAEGHRTFQRDRARARRAAA